MKFIIASLSIVCFSMMSCFILPSTTVKSIDELIDNTNDIYVVVCNETKRKNRKRNRPQMTYCELTVIDVIKGEAKDKLNRVWWTSTYNPTTFDNHTDTTFWNNTYAGRYISAYNKTVPEPIFGTGHFYLIFNDNIYHPKAAERIAIKNDAWLTYVKQRILDNE